MDLNITYCVVCSDLGLGFSEVLHTVGIALVVIANMPARWSNYCRDCVTEHGTTYSNIAISKCVI